MAVQIKRQALFLIFGYVATLGLTATAAYFSYEEYKAARNEEATFKKQIELADIKIGRIPNLETDVICLRENVTEAVKILPTTKETNEFVNKLNDFLVESKVGIKALTPPQKGRTTNVKDVFDRVIYKLSLSANLDQFLSFLALCEGWERFVRVTSLEIKAGDWDEETGRDEVVHDVSVELETYAYQGEEEKGRTTAIQNYDRRRDNLKDEIVSRRADIRVERYTLVPNPMRRDPFVDPRHRILDGDAEGLPLPEQKAIVENLLARSRELTALSQMVLAPTTNFIRRLELETEIDKKGQALKTDLDQVLAARAISDHTLRRQMEREVLPVVKALLERDQSAAAAATLEDLRRFAQEMALLLDEGEYEAVLRKNEIIAGRVEPGSLGPEGAELLHLIDKTATQAEVALDFAKKDIEIRGTIVAETGSVVVVNGHVLKEGDALEDGLLIHRIASDRIEFDYRGVILARAR